MGSYGLIKSECPLDRIVALIPQIRPHRQQKSPQKSAVHRKQWG